MNDQLIMDEQSVREQICDICYKTWQLGWVAANDGNVTVKIADDVFLATPTQISKSFMTPDKIVKINSKGELIEPNGNYRPSSEIKMHMRCYEERDDIGAVVHAHPPTATGFALAKIHMDNYSLVEPALVLGSVPITPYGTPSTDEVPDAITPYLENHDVFLLENHGALTVGADLLTAYYRMESLELWAKTSFVARMLNGGAPEPEIDRSQLDKLMHLRSNYYKFTGKHPGYKKYND